MPVYLLSGRPLRCRLYLRSKSIALAVLLWFGFAAISSNASPIDDLSRAVRSGGAADAETASPKQFLRAFASVLARTGSENVGLYVAAAVKLRAELSVKIVLTALKARLFYGSFANKADAVKEISHIIQAAVGANSDAAADIVKAAIKAYPFAKSSIVDAATAAAPDQKMVFMEIAADQSRLAFLHPSSLDPGNASNFTLGTLNPANDSEPVPVKSPEQPPSGP